MMNGCDRSPTDVLVNGSLNVDLSYTPQSCSTPCGIRSPTEFQSIVTIEPMEHYPTDPVPLELSFEEHEKISRATEESIAVKQVIRPRAPRRTKKPRFVSPPKILEVPEPDAPKAVAEDDTYSTGNPDDELAMQMERVSVSTQSEDSEDSALAKSTPDPPAARLEQISVRIFATILPDNETPEQRHCDLMQASGRLHELTNGAPVLVVNCGEANTQLMTTFDRIQNCPFNLDGFPDLATFIAFCERVYDWLITDNTHVLLLHAEAEAARTRLLLLCQALACYYESGERRDPTTSQTLRQYVTSYPNGVTCSPVGWLRYAGYMRLFSPENCLFILRSSICIFHLALYNFPVFEENKLRLFFKFYSGCPLRLVYTTHIHTYSNPSSNGLMLSFNTPSNSTDPAATRGHGLYLVGDIAVIAYHCRPYPARRLRLFRLHFHSCQGVTNSLTFQHDDFDEICDALPSSVRLHLHCSQRTTSKSHGLDVREETMSPNSGIDQGTPKNLLAAPMTADDAVRVQDSLENLTATTIQSSRLHNRTVQFRSYVAGGTCNSIMPTDPAPPLNSDRQTTVVRHLRFASQSDSELILPPLPDPETYDISPEQAEPEREHFRAGHRDSDDNSSLHKRILKALFRAPQKHRDRMKVETSIGSGDEFDTKQLMPPPSDTYVVKSAKRRRTVGKKLKQIFSGGRKEGSVENENGSAGSTGAHTPSSDYSSDSNSSSLSVQHRRTPPPRPPPPRVPPTYSPNTRAVKTTASVRGTATSDLGPPQKTRKVTVGSTEHVVASNPFLHHTEDLLEAARRLNFMAGTQELDRLLEELRLTSMNMASGLPPTGSSASSAAYYSPKPYSSSGYPSRTSSAHQSGYHHHHQQQQQQHSESRFHTTRSTSALGSYGMHDPGSFTYSSNATNHAHPGSYNYLKQSSYHSERRTDNLGRAPVSQYPSYRTPYSPVPVQRHQANYTTTLKQRPPMGPRQLSQIHLTIDPECGTTETSQGHTSLVNGQGPSRREQLLESELNSARQELAQLRRAISLVDERRSMHHEEVNSSSRLSPSRPPPPRSPAVSHQQFLSSTSTSYQGQQHGTRSSSTFQRPYTRQDTNYGTSFPLQKRAMSHTNVYGPRSWNLRSQQGSESDLAFRRVTSVTGSTGRSNYSAHRERLRQEREQELLMRQQQSQRQRQMAASTTGLHEHQTLQQQSRHQQQYRSLSAVNQSGGTEAFEEIETIILQPIGRGVQDIDSHVGSMTTLARAPGGSLMDGYGQHAYSFKTSPIQRQYKSARTESAHPHLFADSRARSSSPPAVVSTHTDQHSASLFASAKSITKDLHSPTMQPQPRIKSNRQKEFQSESHASASFNPTSAEVSPRNKSQNAGASKTLVTSPPVAKRSKALPIQPTGTSHSDQHTSPRRYTPVVAVLDDSEFAILGTDETGQLAMTVPPTPSPRQLTPSTPSIVTVAHDAHQRQPEPVMRQTFEELHQLQVEVPKPEPHPEVTTSSELKLHKTTAHLTPEIVEDDAEAERDSGLHRMDDGSRPGLARRGFSSTQFLHRNTSSSDIVKPTVIHQQQAGLGSQQLGPSRFGTSSTLVNNGLGTQPLNASRSQLSAASSTIIGPAPSVTGPLSNGWKTEPTKRAFTDPIDLNNLSIVQETAPAWYRPTLSREAAISILRQQPPGSFLIRDSTTFKDAFGLAVKVATLPPKVTPKSDDLQSELVRHYLIEVVNAPNTKGVRLKGFASEPVFPSLAALIHQHTIDPLALPCRLVLPPVPTNLPSAGSATLPTIVIGQPAGQQPVPQTLADFAADNATVTSAGSVLGAAPSDAGSTHVDGGHTTTGNSGTPGVRSDGGGTSFPNHSDDVPTASSPNVPFVCVLHESPTITEGHLSQGLTFRCLMLGSIDTPQWSTEMCFARAVDQLIPLTLLTAAECDRGVSRVRYTEVQLHVSSHDGITIIDLQRRLFLRRHLPNHVLMYCGIEPRKKEFSHPEQKLHGIDHPKIFGIVVRKGISECTTHVFTECDPLNTADSIVQHIRATYPHMNVR